MSLVCCSLGGSKPYIVLNIVLFILQIVCRVYACFEGKCNTVKCPTDSLPYKPEIKVCTPTIVML